jgi:hypothetical protein
MNGASWRRRDIPFPVWMALLQACDVDAALRLSDAEGFTFAAKIVRGAYVVAEGKRAADVRPLHASRSKLSTFYR